MRTRRHPRPAQHFAYTAATRPHGAGAAAAHPHCPRTHLLDGLAIDDLLALEIGIALLLQAPEKLVVHGLGGVRARSGRATRVQRFSSATRVARLWGWAWWEGSRVRQYPSGWWVPPESDAAKIYISDEESQRPARREKDHPQVLLFRLAAMRHITERAGGQQSRKRRPGFDAVGYGPKREKTRRPPERQHDSTLKRGLLTERWPGAICPRRLGEMWHSSSWPCRARPARHHHYFSLSLSRAPPAFGPTRGGRAGFGGP